ncbi:MAG TPA: DUF222 domain-containing protein, partial [Jiangellaceae bacterium]|nr:DUF222 domain-containing protein [Jiangellaceae bacterium]
MSNSSISAVVHPVVAAFDAVDDALAAAADAAVWALDDAELETVLGRAEEIAAKQAELRMRLVAEADGRDLGRRLGAASTAAWLRGRLRIRPGDARALVETANRVTASAQGPVDYAANVGSAVSGREMPATAAALAAGAISEAHAVVIAKAMRRLPSGLSAEAGAEVERQLAELASRFDPGELGKLADCLLDALRPDTLADDEDEQLARRELKVSEHTGRLSGRFDPEAVAMIRAMLDPLAAPAPADDGNKDERPYPRRMADALVEITRRVLSHTDWLPSHHGTRPHLNIVTQLNPDITTANMDGAAGSDGESSDADGGDDAADAAAPGNGPRRGGRQHPAAHPARLGRGEPTWGRPLSAATIARLACDAGITWIITDPAGVPLNVGREQRTVTAAQWAALTVRDGGCTFPGCTRTAEWCQAHHIIWWRFGGPTDLDNLVLLCSHHHRSVHHHGWNIQLGPDHIPQFIPPA